MEAEVATVTLDELVGGSVKEPRHLRFPNAAMTLCGLPSTIQADWQPYYGGPTRARCGRCLKLAKEWEMM